MKPRPEEEDGPFVEEAQFRGYDQFRTRSESDADPFPEAYDGHAEGKYPCPMRSGCLECWPEKKP